MFVFVAVLSANVSVAIFLWGDEDSNQTYYLLRFEANDL